MPDLNEIIKDASSLMGKDTSMPSVEVVENGQRVSNPRIDPSVMSFIMQAGSLAQLVKIRKLQESTIPVGEEGIPITVSFQIYHIRLNTPWISFSLRNDGPGSIYMAINNASQLLKRMPINVNEAVNEDMKYPIITDLYFRTVVAGTVASLRIRGKQGQSSKFR